MTNETNDKCTLDSSGSTYLCLEGNNVIMRMENKTKKEMVNNLKELALNVSSEKKKLLETKLDEIKKNPSILDIVIPMEEIELLGNFKRDSKESIIAVKMTDSFAQKKGFQLPFTSMSFSNDQATSIASKLPGSVNKTESIAEFAGLVQKGSGGVIQKGKR